MKLTPMKAIRQKCLECSCGSRKDTALCPIEKCPLYLYRFGKRPKVDKNIAEGAE